MGNDCDLFKMSSNNLITEISVTKYLFDGVDAAEGLFVKV